MSNVTDPFAESIHGTNPQYLIEKITRLKIYNSVYWKEECFGLTAETIIDKAVLLSHCGGVYGGNNQPTKFLCLLLKMLQLQPEKEIVIEFITQDEFKYLRLLGAMYMRMIGKADDIYKYLEPLYNDYRKIAYRSNNSGSANGWIIRYIDEFIDCLLVNELECDIALPHIPKRIKLEDLNIIPARVSVLDMELSEEENQDNNIVNKENQNENAIDKIVDKIYNTAIKDDGKKINEISEEMKQSDNSNENNVYNDDKINQVEDHSTDESKNYKDDSNDKSNNQEKGNKRDSRDRERRYRRRSRDNRDSRDKKHYSERRVDRYDSRDRYSRRSRSLDRHKKDRHSDDRRIARSRSPDSRDRPRDRHHRRSRSSDGHDRRRRSRSRSASQENDNRTKEETNDDDDDFVIPSANVINIEKESKKKSAQSASKRFDKIFKSSKQTSAVPTLSSNVVRKEGDKIIVSAPEGTVEYWNQMREALGLKKLK